MTRIADTSFLVALFDADDPRTTEADQLVKQPEPVVIPTEVLGETLGVVHRRVNYAAAASIWRALIRLDHVVLLETADAEAVAE